MVYDDPLSQLSLKKDPNWPKYLLNRGYHGHTEQEIEKELEKIDFNLEEWINYKLNVPNDGLPRNYSHPDIEYPLTEGEFNAMKKRKWGIALCNPHLCPDKWNESSSQFGEVGKRYEWIIWQFAFLEASYPPLPDIFWGSNNILLKIFKKLVYDPFIQNWGMPPDGFWIKLSYHLESENQELVHRGFIVTFNAQGKIFPSPNIYEVENDPNQEALSLQLEY